MTKKEQEELEALAQKELDSLPQKEKPEPAEAEDLSEQEALSKLDRAKLIQVLDRGVVNDRLDIKLPADRVGYWVRERPEDIERIKALGGRFESSQTILSGRSLHGSESDRIRVGDVVLMSIPRAVDDTIRGLLRDRKRNLVKQGKKEFLDKNVQGIPHYEGA